MKFEYSRSASTSLADARKARRIVYAVRGTFGAAVAGGLTALIMLTSWEVWVPVVCFVGIGVIVWLVLEHAEDVADWYGRYKSDYERAKSYGVRDE